MSLAKIKTLYEQDFALWVETTVNQLKSGDLSQVDLENLIDEVESLTKRDKRSLESGLITLFEHASFVARLKTEKVAKVTSFATFYHIINLLTLVGVGNLH